MPKLAELRLSPLAKADMEEIWLWTSAEWSVEQAVRYNRSLEAAILYLREFPLIRPTRDIVDPPVRVELEGRHVIIYRFDGETLDVLRVLHQSSNWMAEIRN